jgi:hypothetical protein
VLVGEDSLEANVGHLAAITGGSVFVASGSDIAAVVTAAAESLRSCPLEARQIEGHPDIIEVVRGGAVVRATWSAATLPAADAVHASGIAAFTGGLAIARMNEETAAEFAESAGIASYLTSLVLVDEVATVQETVPAMRKVRLPAPRLDDGIMCAIDGYNSFHIGSYLRPPVDRRSMKSYAAYEPTAPTKTVEWDAAPAQLLNGDLSSLDVELAERLLEKADDPQVKLWAGELGVKPIVLVIAALAWGDRHRSRTAERIARKVFGDTPPAWLDELSGCVLDYV